MIAVVSCHHYADDERIFHRQVKLLIQENFDVQYFTRSTTELIERDGLQLYKNFKPELNTTELYQKKLLNLFKKNPPKILHIHEPELLWLAKNAKEKFGTVIFYDVHEDYPSLINTFSNWPKPIQWLKKTLWIKREKKYLPWVDEVILASPAIINCNYDLQGFRPNIIENFPETKLFPNTKLEFNRNDILVYHGHLAPERGITELVESMQKVKAKAPDVILNLFGTFRTKEYKQVVLGKINSLGLGENILWHGQVAHREIWQHLVKAKVGLLPFPSNHLTRIGTPTKLFEYMAAGCRIVASDLPPLKQFEVQALHLVKPGSVGQLSEAIIHALNDKTNTGLQENRNSIYSKYNWNSLTENFLSMYEEYL